MHWLGGVVCKCNGETVDHLCYIVLKRLSCGIMFSVPLGSTQCYGVGWWTFSLVGVIGLVNIHPMFGI
jgi:hypothetical protein